MPFQEEDFQELLEQLQQRPEWQDALRRLLLMEPMKELVSVLHTLAGTLRQMHELLRSIVASQEQNALLMGRFIEVVTRGAEVQGLVGERLSRLEEGQRRLEEAMARLAEAQARTEEQVGRLEEAMARLMEAQACTEERVGRLEEGQRRLEEAMARLAEAQARTEERVDRLEEGQRRLEEAMARLAKAQARTEERVGRLEEAMARLMEAQARTEEQMAALIRTQERVERRLSDLEGLKREFESYKAMFGATLEEEAEAMVRWVLEQKGYRPIGPGYPLILSAYEEGEKSEIDAVIPVQAPDQRILWVVVEAKARQSPRAIQAWANRMRSEGFRKRLAAAGAPGPYLVYAYGIRVDLSCEVMAKQAGIGLVTGRGERVAPAAEIPPES